MSRWAELSLEKVALTDSLLDERRLREFEAVRSALDAAGLPSADFGRFTSNRHPEIVRSSAFDYRGAVPVLLAVMRDVSDPDVLESIVRSLSTPFARPSAALPLIALFKDTVADGSLKWAVGNALCVVTTAVHKRALLELALDQSHGRGRQMIVERLGRISGDPVIVDTLRALATDPDVALHAQAGLRRRLDHDEAEELIRSLIDHESEGVRRAAVYNLRMAERALRRAARRQTR